MVEQMQVIIEVNKINGTRSIYTDGGVALLYEIGDCGYGMMSWICKGYILETKPTFYEECRAWLNNA